MIQHVLFFEDFFEKDPHLNTVELSKKRLANKYLQVKLIRKRK